MTRGHSFDFFPSTCHEKYSHPEGIIEIVTPCLYPGASLPQTVKLLLSTWQHAAGWAALSIAPNLPEIRLSPKLTADSVKGIWLLTYSGFEAYFIWAGVVGSFLVYPALKSWVLTVAVFGNRSADRCHKCTWFQVSP